MPQVAMVNFQARLVVLVQQIRGTVAEEVNLLAALAVQA
jgi:hypothetical protein